MKWTLDSNARLSELSLFAGGKATNMGRLSQKGFTVPEWFAVTSEALKAFVAENRIEAVLKPSSDLAALSRRVEEAFLSAKVSAALQAEILERLGALGLEDRFVAVRSSGLDEDSAQNSFAGQFSSFLFQKGWAQIEESLKRCWASGFSERALSYRIERGLGLDDIRVGVVIQKMVNAEAAGVVFSRHPIKVLDRDLILVSSVWGLGEGLVSGELESDDFEVSRKDSKIEKHVVGKSHAMRQAPQGGVVKEALTPEAGKQSSLTDDQVREIAELSARLEEALGAPQDSEWVLEQGKLYLVQTRPVTSLPPADFYSEAVNGTLPTLWDNSNIIESYSGVTSPLTFSFASRAYHQVYVQFCDLMGVPKELVEARAKVFRNMLGLIRGRIYYNLVNWYQLVLMLPGSSSNKGFMDTMMGVKAQIRPEMAGIFDFVKEAPRYSFGARARLLFQTVWRFLKIDTIIGDFNAHFVRVYEGTRKLDYSSWSLPRLVDHYHYLDDQLLKQWKAPIINDYLCMLFFGLLKKLTENWVSGKEGADSLQNDLLCGEGGLESTEPTKFLMRIAAKVDKGDPAFRAWLLATASDEAWRQLQADRARSSRKTWPSFSTSTAFAA
jgi:rifampicin phosphotransferase